MINMVFGITEEERHVPRKLFKNGILDFAHRRPVIAFFVVPLLIDGVAKVLQGGYRTVRHGDYKLGSVAVMSDEEEDSTLYGGASQDYDLFGSLTNKNTTIGVTDPNSGILKGEFYRDTTHLTPVRSVTTAGENPSLYRDTSHRLRANYRPFTPTESGFIGRSTGARLSDGAISGNKTADPNLVDLVGTGLFAGLSGARRI